MTFFNIKFTFCLFQTANANYTDNSVVDADPDDAAEVHWTNHANAWKAPTSTTNPDGSVTVNDDAGYMTKVYQS